MGVGKDACICADYQFLLYVMFHRWKMQMSLGWCAIVPAECTVIARAASLQHISCNEFGNVVCVQIVQIKAPIELGTER